MCSAWYDTYILDIGWTCLRLDLHSRALASRYTPLLARAGQSCFSVFQCLKGFPRVG